MHACDNRLLLNEAGLAGILTVLHACIDIKGTILDRFHFLLFFLSASMNPRYLNTVDVDLNPLSVTVRVGQAVETVGQAGRPKTITGFQVLLYGSYEHIYLIIFFFNYHGYSLFLLVDAHDTSSAGLQGSR